MQIAVRYFELADTSSPLGLYQTITATVNPVVQQLRLYTGVGNEFGEKLTMIIAFEDVLVLRLTAD